MTELLIALASVAYVAGGACCSRHIYGKYRPSRVPLCGKPDGHADKDIVYRGYYRVDSKGHYAGGHDTKSKRSCYGDLTEGDVLFNALVTGLLWPGLVPVSLVLALVTAGHGDRPAERRYKAREALARAEQELAEANAELERIRKTDD